MVLEDRSNRNKLRKVVHKALDRDIITKEERGFVATLVERFRSDIEKKNKQLTMLQGEIAQLRANEKIIIDLIQNLIAAAERDAARQDTMRKLRESREIEEERHRLRKEENEKKEQQEEAAMEKKETKKKK